MTDIKWIKITTDMFDDEKIKLIESMPEKDTILVIWVKLLALCGKCNHEGKIFLNSDLPYNEEMLSSVFNRPVNSIRMAIDIFKSFKMIEIQEGVIEIVNWGKYQNLDAFEQIKEQNRLRQKKYRELHNINTINKNNNNTNNIDNDYSNTYTYNTNKIKNKNKRDNVTVTLLSRYVVSDSDFNELWKKYPNKDGKKQAEKHFFSTVKTTENLEKIRKALENYLKSDRVKRGFIKNGSTWFNNWQDWVDYEPEKPQVLEI